MVRAVGDSLGCPCTTFTGRPSCWRSHGKTGDSGVAEAKMNTRPQLGLIACKVPSRKATSAICFTL